MGVYQHEDDHKHLVFMLPFVVGNFPTHPRQRRQVHRSKFSVLYEKNGMQSTKYTHPLDPFPKYTKQPHVYNLLSRRLDAAHEIKMPSIVVTTCIALIALLISPAFTVVEPQALAISLSIVIALLSLLTCSVADHEEDEAVTKEAQNIVRAAFLMLAKDPGSTSASFKVANGVVVNRKSSPAGTQKSREHGSATGIGLEEGGLVRWSDLGPEGEEVES